MASVDATMKTEVLEREVIFTRVFDAPRSLVWRAMTDPEHLPKWWGPNGYVCVDNVMDIRKGGRWRFVMNGPNGLRFDNEILYRDVVPEERLEYTITDGKADGPKFDASLTLTDLGDGRTKVVMHSVFPTKEALEAVKKFGAVEGGEQTLGKLGEHLRGMKPGLFITRTFDAPRRLVFEAWSKPEHLQRWFGPRGFTLPTCEMEFRAGGAYRLNMRFPDGRDHWVNGKYVEIVPGERIVYSAVLDNAPGLEILTTVTFEDDGPDRTRLVARQAYNQPAPEGAYHGWNQTLDRLAEALPSLRA